MSKDAMFDDLPADAELAFVEVMQRLRNKYESQLEEGVTDEFLLYLQFDFITSAISAAQALDLHLFAKWPEVTWQNVNNTVFMEVQAAIRKFEVSTRVRNSRRTTTYSVVLTTDEKEKIRNYLERVRRIIESSNASNIQKDAILKKVNALIAEVDRNRTRFDAFADLAGKLAQVSGDFAKNGVEPWMKALKPIFEVLGGAKEREEKSQQLPEPAEKKQIEPPKPQLESRPKNSDSDEIPF